MSTATLVSPTASSSVTVAPVTVSTFTRRDRRLLQVAMADSDTYVIEFEYVDSKGNRTRRTVSPIRFSAPDRVLALCLCREEPRQFHLSRCRNFRLIPAEQVIMPVAIDKLN